MTDQTSPPDVTPLHCDQAMEPKPIAGYSGPVSQWHCTECGTDMMLSWASPTAIASALSEYADALSAMLTSRDNTAPCDEFIYHGPGHQSRTRCRVKGAHDVHQAVYGEFSHQASWRTKPDGHYTFSGVFDEPPMVGDDQ